MSYDYRVIDDTSSNAAQRLKTLLKEAGYKSTRLDTTRRLVMFSGRTRDWTLSANISNGWLHVATYVCEVPDANGVRAELLDLAMTANQAMSLTKFVKGAGLVFEFEYRIEHVDADVLRNLLSLALTNLEEWYPKLFRVVSGDAALACIAGGGPLIEVETP